MQITQDFTRSVFCVRNEILNVHFLILTIYYMFIFIICYLLYVLEKIKPLYEFYKNSNNKLD